MKVKIKTMGKLKEKNDDLCNFEGMGTKNQKVWISDKNKRKIKRQNLPSRDRKRPRTDFGPALKESVDQRYQELASDNVIKFTQVRLLT